MFWGLIMEANKRYTQSVAKTFHMSMACLDVSQPSADDYVQVMCSTEGTTYLICNLNRKGMTQTPLDLNFQQGSKIEFVCNGKGSVHLTGYVIDDMDDFDDEADDEEVEDEESQDEQDITQELLKSLNAKRKIPQEKSKAVKKAKIDEECGDDDHEDESDDESEDEDMDETLDSKDSDDDDDEDVEEEEGDDESDEEEKEQVVLKKQKQQKKQPVEQKKPVKQEKAKMNGSVESPAQDKKNKKQKNQQNAQEQQPKKKVEQNNQEQKKKGEQNQKQEKKGEQNQVTKKTVEGGVQIEDIKVGNGAPAKPGKMVSVYYVGKLQKNGKKFDATQQGEGFKFRLGKGEVIKGWDVGISGMKVGGKRKITIPAHMGYGSRGSPPRIPGNSTLVFDVELKNVH